MDQKNDKIQQRIRCKRLFCQIGAIILAGLVYAVFAVHTGLYIPCPFRVITGFRCPGCGVSHMCTALLQLQWKEAFFCNPAVFCMLPLLVIIGGHMGIQYIRCGKWRLSALENCMVVSMAVILVVFGIVRNIVGV